MVLMNNRKAISLCHRREKNWNWNTNWNYIQFLVFTYILQVNASLSQAYIVQVDISVSQAYILQTDVSSQAYMIFSQALMIFSQAYIISANGFSNYNHWARWMVHVHCAVPDVTTRLKLVIGGIWCGFRSAITNINHQSMKYMKKYLMNITVWLLSDSIKMIELM